MTKRILTAAGAFASLAVIGHFVAKPALAAVRAALVENVDERGRNPYQQQVTCYSATSNSCQAIFPPVPANMRLVVEHINATLDSPSPFSHADVSGNGMVEAPLLTMQGSDAEGNGIYIANQPMLMYYEAGQTPAVSMFSQSAGFEFMSGGVVLTGYLVSLN